MHYSSVNHEVSHVGNWHDAGRGLEVFDAHTLTKENNTEIETLVVVTKQERPYVMLKKGFKGNAAYDGFAIDLLKVSFNFRRYNFFFCFSRTNREKKILIDKVPAVVPRI